MALQSASWNVRPMAITSPTDFICVVSVVSLPGNFSNCHFGNLCHHVIDGRLEEHGVFLVMSLGISSSVMPTASFAAIFAIGKPVALLASAELRETRGFISITTMRPDCGIDRELNIRAAGLDARLRG